MKSKSLRETAVVKILGYTLGIFFALASSGYADETLYHGSFCNPNQGAGEAHYSQYGVDNASPDSTLTVNCAGIIPGTVAANNETPGVGCSPPSASCPDLLRVVVTVLDRNPSQNVSCTLTPVPPDGFPTSCGCP